MQHFDFEIDYFVVLTLFTSFSYFYTPWKRHGVKKWEIGVKRINPFRPDVLNRFNDLCFQKTGKDWNNRTLTWSGLTLKAPIPQNGHTHSNNLSASADELFECVWPFCAVGGQRVKANAIHFTVNLCFRGLIAYIWVTSLQNVIYKQHLGLNHLQ